MFKWIGKLLCCCRFHKIIFSDGSNVAGGSHCVRDGCDYEVDPIEWDRHGLPEVGSNTSTPKCKKLKKDQTSFSGTTCLWGAGDDE